MGKKPLSKIKGIAYRDNGEIRVNARRPLLDTLDELPYPAYDLVDMELYLNPPKRLATAASRNAPSL
jgi:radical SAM superfamily enzyme YgiQ (UPF0313 family)